MPPSPVRWMAAALLAIGVAARPAAAQEPYTLSGTVVDAATQRPLADVSVTLRGTQARANTNAQGQYSLTARVAPGAYTLAFSRLGRGAATRAVTLGADRTVDVGTVTLAETALQLEGIVATGQGAPVERRQVGNTVATVSGDQVNRAPGATSIDQALQGRIPGAVISQNSGMPGAGASIRLRGTSSILGGADPLIVIDGVLVDNNFDPLVAVGSNATRQGSAVSNRLSDIAPGDIERVEVLKGAAAAALYGSRANNGVIQIFTRRGTTGRPQVTLTSEVGTSTRPRDFPVLLYPQAGLGDSIYLRKEDGSRYRLGDPITRYNVQDQIFRTGTNVNTQASLAGGAGDTRYYLSGSWFDQEGVLRNTNADKRTVRARITQRLSRLLEVTGGASYVQSRAHLVPEGEQTQGALTAVLFTPTGFNPAFSDSLGRYPYSPIVGVNPLQVIRDFTLDQNVNRFIGSFQATLTPVENLSVNYIFGLDDGREENVYIQPPFSTSATFTGSISSPVRSVRKWNSDLTANLLTRLSSNLELTSTAGFRYTSDRINTIRAGAEGLPPGQDVVGGATQFASQGITELRTKGGFIQERVNLADRLFLTGALNTEAASAFGSDQRWQLFPRAGVSWVVHEMPFFERSPLASVLSALRLRASYGETGGQPPSAYLTRNYYTDALFSGRPGQAPSDILANPDLKPERQRELEGGVDLGFFNDRAQLELTYYSRRTTDLVLQVPLQSSSGYSLQFQNIGEISDRGIEAALSANLVRRGGFNWDARLAYAADRNKVEQLRTSADTLVFEYLNAVIEGEPVGVFVGGVYQRDANGQIVLTNGVPRRLRESNGAIARRKLGDPNPSWTASLNNNFTIGRNLELGILFDGRFGNDVANFTRRIQDFFGLSACTEQEIRGELATGWCTQNGERHLIYEAFVEDGSFIKLREASASYRFEGGWVERIGAESVALRVAGRNLHTWTDYSGVDPEVNLFSGSTVARGVDFVTTPIPRQLSVGVTVNF
ncbi:MAG TPA: SusC/RagA family TonB-linked outer membrane protein [Longimicrobium sp.]|nr:SusC/RagA family TonB-linked outer membrane protein [Longimicrobium sp.]